MPADSHRRAAGPAFLCVAGAEKALAFGLSPVMAALPGMLTGVGGGMVRDVLLAEIPAVLRSDLYAVAALAGAIVVVGGQMLQLPHVPVAIAGGLPCLRPADCRAAPRLAPANFSRTTSAETGDKQDP